MFQAIRKKILSAGLIWLILLLCCTACGKKEESRAAETKLWNNSKLSECQLWIHNTSCSEDLQVRTVPEDSLRKIIAGLCEKAEPFRPLTQADFQLGGSTEPWLVFRDGNKTFTFLFREVEKQLAFDNPHRDSLLIWVAVQTDGEGSALYTDGHVWYYSLPAADYAKLAEILFTYAEGELVLTP